MTQATKSLLIITIVLAFITGLRYTFKGGSGSKALTSAINSVNISNINKIVIDAPNNEWIELKLNSGNWQVSNKTLNEWYPADNSRVENLLNQTTNVTPKAVMTRNPSKYPLYKVDTTGTAITFFSGDKKISDFIVGRFQFVSQNDMSTYIRMSADDNVLAIDGFLGTSLTANVDGWRNKQIWSIPENEIYELKFNYPADSSFTVTKTDVDDKWTLGGDTLKTSTFSTTLSAISSLRASGFTYDNRDLKPTWSIDINMTKGTVKTLYITKFENSYYGWSDEYPYIFKLSDNTAKNQILKGKNALLKG